MFLPFLSPPGSRLPRGAKMIIDEWLMINGLWTRAIFSGAKHRTLHGYGIFRMRRPESKSENPNRSSMMTTAAATMYWNIISGLFGLRTFKLNLTDKASAYQYAKTSGENADIAHPISWIPSVIKETSQQYSNISPEQVTIEPTVVTIAQIQLLIRIFRVL